jgi:hypothetical protein
MTASLISEYVGIGKVYVHMPTNIVMYGEFISANQIPSLKNQNVWIFSVGKNKTSIKGDMIIMIVK